MSKGYVINFDGKNYELMIFEELSADGSEREVLASLHLTKKTARDLGQKLLDISKDA